MKFYVEFNKIELCEWFWTCPEDKKYLPWNEDLRALIRVHQMYREWINTAPQNEFGSIPQNILDALNELLEIYAGLQEFMTDQDDLIDPEEIEIARRRSKLRQDQIPGCFDLYPGLQNKNYSSQQTSISTFTFDTSFDIDALLSNENGIPTTEETLNLLLPKSTQISGSLEIPIEMNSDQIAEAEAGNGGWSYIGWDTVLKVAGICVDSQGIGINKTFCAAKTQ